VGITTLWRITDTALSTNTRSLNSYIYALLAGNAIPQRRD